MEQDRFVTKIFILIGMAMLILLAFFVLKAILLSIVVGLLLAYILNPIYSAINSKIRSRNLSASILIIAIILIFAIPFFFIAPMLIKQTFETYTQLGQLNIAEIFQNVLPSLLSSETSTALSIQINNALSKAFSLLITQLTNWVVQIPNILLQLFVTFFVFYFSVKDSEKLKQYFLKLSPFSVETERKFLKEFRTITNGIIYGQFLIALLQAIALGVGLFVLGVPRPLMLALATFFVSIIPILGPFLVWIPVSLYLLLTGRVVTGIILALYGSLFVSSIDNFIRPYILSRSSNLSTAISLIGIIGGLYAFGIVGIVLGPLILAYVMILIEFYKEGRLDELFKRQ